MEGFGSDGNCRTGRKAAGAARWLTGRDLPRLASRAHAGGPRLFQFEIVSGRDRSTLGKTTQRGSQIGQTKLFGRKAQERPGEENKEGRETAPEIARQGAPDY